MLPLRKHITLPIVAAIAAALALTALALQGSTDRPPTTHPDRAKLFTVPQLADIDIFVGAWKVKETYFDERGVERAGREGTEEIVWMLDRHALLRRYNTAAGDSVYRAMGIITWNATAGAYACHWYDNAPAQGPSPRSQTGSFDPATATLTWEMKSESPGGAPQTHRIIERFVSEEERTTTTFAVSDGRVRKIMETRYTRAEPCPASRGTVLLPG